MDETVHRQPWGDFPDVVVHVPEIAMRDKHPSYPEAKRGKVDAGIALVNELVTPDSESMDELRSVIGNRKPIVIAVTALEKQGYNCIPDVMAQAISYHLGLPCGVGDIVQSNKVGHTRQDGWHRLVTPALFEGAVREAEYVLVDDHVGFGGTLANLRGYIEHHGGKVIATTTMTETREARHLALRPETRKALENKHGQQFDHFWRQVFGHGTDGLTNIEAGYLSRVETLDAIRTRMAQAVRHINSEAVAGFARRAIAIPTP